MTYHTFRVYLSDDSVVVTAAEDAATAIEDALYGNTARVLRVTQSDGLREVEVTAS